MTRMRSCGAGLLAAPLLLLLAVPAHAVDPQGVADQLRSGRVYVEPGITTGVDVGRVRSAAEQAGVDVYVAILADADGGSRQDVNSEITRRLGREAVLITAIGRELSGGAGCGVGLDEGEADRIVNTGGGSAEAAIMSAISRLEVRTDSGTLDSGCDGDGSGGGGGLGTGVLVALGLLGVGVVGGCVLLARHGRRRAATGDAQDGADAQSLYDRLGFDDDNTHDDGDLDDDRAARD